MYRNRISVTILAAAIAAAFAPAYAQDTPPADSAAPQSTDASQADQAQANQAQTPKQGTAQHDDQKRVVNLSQVTVTPRRQSLESAQSL